MLYVFSDYAKLSEEAALFIEQVGRRSIEQRGRFDWVLSGGTTPRGVLVLLAAKTPDPPDLWKNTHVFWGDERYVPPECPDSNYFMAFQALLGHVDIPTAQIHPIPTEMPEPRKAAEQYDSVFPAEPDLVLLGMGEDGHTASLFPHSGALRERDKRFTVSESPIEPRVRITLTPPAIAAARDVLVLVSGPEKAPVLRRIFADHGDVDEAPARLVRNATWFVDQAAAQQIFELRISGVARIGGDIESA